MRTTDGEVIVSKGNDVTSCCGEVTVILPQQEVHHISSDTPLLSTFKRCIIIIIIISFISGPHTQKHTIHTPNRTRNTQTTQIKDKTHRYKQYY